MAFSQPPRVPGTRANDNELSKKPTVGYIYSFRKEPTANYSPTNLWFGAVELAGLGCEVKRFFPSQYVSGVRARTATTAYAFFLVQARHELQKCDVLVVYSHSLIMLSALFRTLGLLKAKIIVIHSCELGLPRGGRLRSLFRIVDRFVLRNMMLSLLATSESASLVRRYTGLSEKQVSWIRWGVDADFYKPSVQEPGDYVVAIGNDVYRDWRILAEIARRLPDVPFRVVTQSRSVGEGSFPPNVQVCTGLNLAQSRDALERARLLILTTTTNVRFSGAMTVMNALLTGTPVVVDEEAALSEYLLEPNVNCLAFRRGDVDSAVNAIQRILGSDGLHDALREQGLKLRRAHSMTTFGSTLLGHIADICGLGEVSNHSGVAQGITAESV